MRFTWDETKSRSNQKKHDGITFEEAAHVFRDPFRLTRQDRIEDGEERWQTIGVVHGVTVLLVAHTITEDDDGGAYRANPDHLSPTRHAKGKEAL